MIYIHHHLGLGDHFDCNGMVRYILKSTSHNSIGVFAKSNYFDMIKYMYRDDDNIKVIKVSKDNEYEDIENYITKNGCKHYLRVGHENYPWEKAIMNNDKNCWEYFYDQLNIPYDIRYSMFYFERDLEEEIRVFNKLNPSGEPYIFMHDDKSRGFVLNQEHFLNKDIKVIKNDITENIFHFITILERAEEIHCMESSFKSLIDIYAKTADLYFHDFRGHPLGKITNRKWSTINYE